MKTEHIIENLLDWKRTWKPTGQLRLTIEAAIGELQFAENKLRLVVARQNELIQRLKEERDEARREAIRVRGYCTAFTGLRRKLPWEKENRRD